MKGATGDFYVDDILLDQVIDARIVHLGGVGLMHRMDGHRNAELVRKAKQRGSITTIDVFAGIEIRYAGSGRGLALHGLFLAIDRGGACPTGLTGLNDPAHFFLDHGVQCCVFTLGADGAYYHHADGTKFKVQPLTSMSNARAAAGMRSMPGSPLRYATGSIRKRPCGLPRRPRH